MLVSSFLSTWALLTCRVLLFFIRADFHNPEDPNDTSFDPHPTYYPVVELEYPNSDACERYILLQPKDKDHYNPILDFEKSLYTIIEHYLTPAQQALFGTIPNESLIDVPSPPPSPSPSPPNSRASTSSHKSSGSLSSLTSLSDEEAPTPAPARCVNYLRALQRAIHRQDGPLFIKTAEQINAILRSFKYPKLPDDPFAEPPRNCLKSYVESWTEKGLPQKVLMRIIEENYQRCVGPNVQSLRRYEAFTSAVYGELTPSLVHEIVTVTKLNENSLFLDLGSGVGNVVVQASLQTGCRSYGIELMPSPARVAREMVEQFRIRCRMWGVRCGEIEVEEGDMLKSRKVDELIKEADVVLVDNKVFEESLNEALKPKFLDLKEGAIVVSLAPFAPVNARLTERNLDDITSAIFDVTERPYYPGAVSWGNGGGYYYLHRVDRLDAIATLGPNGIFSSYITVWRYIFHGRELVEEGCKQHPEIAFKIPTLFGWLVVVNSGEMFEEIKRASEEDLSVLDLFEEVLLENERSAVQKTLQTDYTISPTIHRNPYHIDVVRGPLTRNIGARFDDVRDELRHAFNHYISPRDDWLEVPNVIKAIQNIVVRTSNRFFVGLPLCRNEDWCDLNLEFAINVMINGTLIGFFPEVLHPIVGRIFSNRKRSLRRAVRHLTPIFDERFAMEREHGSNWPGKPNDLISWLIDSCAKNGEDWQKGSYEDLALRVIAVNFVAIHTTSQAFTQALFHLAANPQIVEPLREEVRTTVEREGEWSKLAMVQMRLLDSFMKESQRRVGVSPTGMNRKTRKDYRFSSGVVIPAGTTVGVAAYHLHHSEEAYPAPYSFIPRRFADLRDKEGEAIKHHMVTPTTNWVTFGAGKHACPGRFFAVNEIKALLVHVLMNYDVKLKDGNEFPPEICFAGFVTPNSKAKLLFRKRRT
ncbi:hypothetical protein V5O48_003459 [Marasmius crinis-equi]|uniref:Histone-lysine N-methyltransferase, H3 lysine-79 specific n=1 Tax=Marasmius crinis-equi TaxID=585013 RepID=A0ABR3FST4_9AGAR